MIYKDGDIEEGVWRNGRIYHPTRYKPKKSLIRSSYAYRFGQLAKIDVYGNVIVHPLETGMPTVRLVIMPDGHRYRGDLDGRLKMSGKGTLYFEDGNEFCGYFNSDTMKATGYIVYKDGKQSKLLKDFDMKHFY